MTPNPYIRVVSFETIILGLFNYSDIPLHNPTRQDGDSHFWRHLPLSIFGPGCYFPCMENDPGKSYQTLPTQIFLLSKELSSRERIFLVSMSPVLSSHSDILIKTRIKEPSLFLAKKSVHKHSCLAPNKTIQIRRTKGRWTEKIPSNPTVGSTSKNCTRA